MDPKVWESVNELVADAMELAPEERAAYVASRTANKAVERQSALDLLAHADGLEHFLERPALADPAVFRSFLPGQILDNRFRIIRFLAEGGMGEVFEAEDLRSRHQRVALKTIRPEIVARPGILERFESEVYHGKNIKHENICRVFDVHLHRDPDEPELETVFLTMEMLSGESLAERLRQQGPMSWEQALPLIKQMAAGLSAAHRAGVVHGDFKPENVMLEGNPPHAVVMDLGLARELIDDLRAGKSGEYPTTPGTPGYMAPEVPTSGTSIRSDIYALGAVISAMVTGNPSGSAKLPRRWVRVIQRCLETDPQSRYGSVEEVVVALTGNLRSARRLATALAAVLILTVLTAIEIRNHRPRPVVAVLGFNNMAGASEKAWLSPMMARSLEASLAESGYFHVVPDREVERAKQNLGIAARNGYDQATLARLRRNLGIDLVISGSYSNPEPDRIALRVLLQRAEGFRPEVIWEGAEAETVTGINALVVQAAERCVERIGSSAGAGIREKQRAGALEGGSNLKAARFYEEGVTRLELWDASGAKALLQQAVEAQPDFALAHAALADAYLTLGYRNEARKEAQLAYDQRSRLTAHQSALLSASYYEIRAQWELAAGVYQKLYQAHHDDLNAGLHLITAEAMAGRAPEALAVAAALRKLPVAGSAAPQIDLAEGLIWVMRSHNREASDLDARAAHVAESRQQWDVAAEALLRQGYSCQMMGEYDLSLKVLRRSRELFERLGNRGGIARVLAVTAKVFVGRGDLDQAGSMYADATSVLAEIGSQENSSEALNGFGSVLQLRGDLAGAEHAYEGALKNARDMNFVVRIGSELHRLGTIRQDQGRYEDALNYFNESLHYFRQAKNRLGDSFVDDNIGEIFAIRGELPKAREDGNAALKIRQQLENEPYEAESWDDLGAVSILSGDIDEAERDYRNAMAIRQKAHDAGGLAMSKLNFARVAQARGKNDESEALAKQAIAEFKRENRPRDVANCEIVIAVNLLAQNRYTDAQLEIGNAQAYLDKSEFLLDRLRAKVVSSSILGETGESAAARRQLEDVVREAGRLHAIPLQYEARMAEARILSLSGKGPEAEEAAEEIKKDADEIGLEVHAYH